MTFSFNSEYGITNGNNILLDEAAALGHAVWSETELNSNWVAVNDTTEYTKSDYPKMWDILTGIYNGTINSEHIKVCTEDDATTMTTSENEWEVVLGQQKLAYYYIIDTVNETFKLPRCIDDELFIGKSNIIVEHGNNQNGGQYSILNDGCFVERGFLAKLIKDTKTVTEEETITDEETGEETTTEVEKEYTYYKVVEWNDDEAEIELETINNYSGEKNYRATKLPLTVPITKDMVNTKFSVYLYTGKIERTEDGTNYFELDTPYSPLITSRETKTKNSYSVPFVVYDEQYNNVNNPDYAGWEFSRYRTEMMNWINKYLKVIGSSTTEVFLLYQIYGYTLPPLVENYTTNSRLYIKVR